MKKLNYFLMLALISVGLLLHSCSDDDDDDNDSKVEPFEFTQAGLDAATTVLELDITGGTMAHNGNSEMTGDDTYRDVYSNMADASMASKEGDIITKRVYLKDSLGNKTGDPVVTFAMVKQAPGYDSTNGDWEWVMMPGAPTATNPNGLLTGEGVMRGNGTTMANCAACHSGGTDYRFKFPS